MNYATWDRDEEGWRVETAAQAPPAIGFGGPGGGSSIRVFNLDTEPLIGIGHYQPEYGGAGAFESKLLFTYQTSTGWLTDTVQESVQAVDYCSLINNSNRPVVAYWDVENNTSLLKLAIRNAPLPSSSSWVIQKQDPPSGKVNGQVSAALLRNGDYLFCYYDGDGEQALRGARLSSDGVWQDQIIDGAGIENDAGRRAAITSFGRGTAIVAYSYAPASGAEELRFGIGRVSPAGVVWNTETAIVTGVVDSVDLASNFLYALFLAYHKQVSDDLILARLNEGEENVDPDGIAFDHVSIAVGERDIIAYEARKIGQFARELRLAARIAPYFPPRTRTSADPEPDRLGGPNSPSWLTVCFAFLSIARKNVAPEALEDPDLLSVPTIFERLNAIQQESEGGRRLLGLFSNHAEELANVEIADTTLGWKAYRTVSSFLPGWAYLGVGRGVEQIFSQSMADQALDLWENVKQKASPGMAAEILAELDRWGNFQDFVGANFDETFDAIAKGDVTKVNVDPTVEIARWSLVHGTGEVISGTGSAALFSVTPGEVTLTWEDLEGHSFRSPNPQTQTLSEFDVIEFEGVFVPFGDTNGDGITNYVDLFFFSLFWRGDPNAVSFSTNPILSQPDAIDDRDLLELIWRWR